MIDQLTKTLFENKTLDVLIKCIKENRVIASFELFDLDFRLYKNKNGFYNFELLAFDDKGAYFKPIGFYQIVKGGLFSKDKIYLTILGEFESSYKQNKLSNERIIEVKLLDSVTNGLIASCSSEAIQSVQTSFLTGNDQFFRSNGLELELIVAFDGNPQLYLDDRYGVEDPLIVYVNSNSLAINPTVKYSSKFRELQQLELFTAFKRL